MKLHLGRSVEQQASVLAPEEPNVYRTACVCYDRRSIGAQCLSDELRDLERSAPLERGIV
jgi:hypothetical protein